MLVVESTTSASRPRTSSKASPTTRKCSTFRRGNISVGGLGVLLDAPATTATDRELHLDRSLPGLDAAAMLDRIRSADTDANRATILRDALSEMVARRDRSLLAEGREVARVAAFAEADRSVRRVDAAIDRNGRPSPRRRRAPWPNA